MELVRKTAMVVATLAVALGIGYGIQSDPVEPSQEFASAKPSAQPKRSEAAIPKDIVPLAAGFTPMPALVTAMPEPAPLPDAAFAPHTEPEPAAETIKIAPVVEACPVTLDVMASAQATLDITLIAPCRASQRVVLRHGGLAITATTSVTGAVFASLPGMDAAGDVSVLFSDGQMVDAAAPLADLALYRRFAVQWMAEDAFQLNAFENGAGYGEAGHVSASNPQRRLPNVPLRGGYLSLLGDATSVVPMLAEVYTFPMDRAQPVELTLEASVTAATCNRELLGEMLLSEGGRVTKTDLTMATPTCDGIGDVLVLNNPLPDLKLAAAK